MLPKALITVGDHIRTRRIQLQLTQNQVAKRIGVATDTITNWELNRNVPQIQFMPKIIAFLNYVPNVGGEPESLGEELNLYRMMYGKSIKLLARKWGMDEKTLFTIESNERFFQKSMNKVRWYLFR